MSAMAAEDPYGKLQLAMFDVQPEAAQQAVAAINDARWIEPMLVFVCAASRNNPQIADGAWAKAVGLMKSKGSRRDRVFAAELAKPGPPADSAVRNWAASPVERSIVLAALGLRYPQKRAQYFALARKLNYSNMSPSRLIAQVTAAAH